VILRRYLHVLTCTNSLEELWAAHSEQMDEFGFDRLFYGCTRFRTQTSLGDPDDFTILTNHSREYVDGFLHSGLFFHAPMMHWALENEGAASWRMIGQMMESDTVTPEERRVYEFNQKMDVRVGYTVSFKPIATRAKGAISLCAKRGISQEEMDAVWQEFGADIHLMNKVAHLKILSLPYNPPNRVLTKRQREALEWVGDGKTMQDIAVIMGLTTATVEKHLRLARETLSVDTTAQAVLKATLHNQMFVVEV
jgi:LuxR family transcriptional regulator, quorum-sensing system regulator SdiA